MDQTDRYDYTGNYQDDPKEVKDAICHRTRQT